MLGAPRKPQPPVAVVAFHGRDVQPEGDPQLVVELPETVPLRGGAGVPGLLRSAPATPNKSDLISGFRASASLTTRLVVDCEGSVAKGVVDVDAVIASSDMNCRARPSGLVNREGIDGVFLTSGTL